MSQEIFAIDVLTALKSSLEQRRKHVAEHACDDASKRILKLSKHGLEILLARDQCP